MHGICRTCREQILLVLLWIIFFKCDDALCFLSTHASSSWTDPWSSIFQSRRSFGIHKAVELTQIVSSVNVFLFPSKDSDGSFSVYKGKFGPSDVIMGKKKVENIIYVVFMWKNKVVTYWWSLIRLVFVLRLSSQIRRDGFCNGLVAMEQLPALSEMLKLFVVLLLCKQSPSFKKFF